MIARKCSRSWWISSSGSSWSLERSLPVLWRLTQAVNFKPDVILLDVDLGDISGFRVAEQLKSSGCPARIVFLSVHESIDFIRAAQDLGAAGYVFKSQITRDLVKTLHAAF